MDVKVTMTEKVTYEATLSLKDFAEMVGGVDESPAQIKALIDDDASRNGDTGIDGADQLLDYLTTPQPTVEIICEDREWTFEMSEPIEVPKIKAPAYEPEF